MNSSLTYPTVLRIAEFYSCQIFVLPSTGYMNHLHIAKTHVLGLSLDFPYETR